MVITPSSSIPKMGVTKTATEITSAIDTWLEGLTITSIYGFSAIRIGDEMVFVVIYD